MFVRGGAFPPRRVRRRARADNDARGEALARVVSRAERSSRSLRAGVGRPLHLRVETSGWYASLGRVRRLARTPRRLRPVEGASPGPHARGRGSRASPRYRRRVSSSRSAVGPSPARALAGDVAADPAESLSPAITRSFIWIVLPLFLLCHACFCGCDTANDDRVVSRTFAQGPQRRRRRRDRRRRDRPDDPRRRADADDDEDDYDPEYAFEADRRRQPRAPPIDDVDDDGGIPPADLFAVAALPRRVAPFPAAAAVVDDARGGRDTRDGYLRDMLRGRRGGSDSMRATLRARVPRRVRVRVARDSRELSYVSSVGAERRAGRGGEVRRAGRTSGRGEGG